MSDLADDIEGDLAQLLTEMDALGDDVDGDIQRLLDEIGAVDDFRVKNPQEKRTHIRVHEHHKALQDTIEAHDAQLVAVIDRAIDAMTQSILRAVETPKHIVRDPETNRVLGSRPAAAVSVTHGVDPTQLSGASRPAQALYQSLTRLGQTVADALARPKRIVRDADGRPQHIE